MPNNFDLRQIDWSDQKQRLRTLMGVLTALCLIAAYFVFNPPGGSPEDLQSQMSSLQSQITRAQGDLARSKLIATKVDRGRLEGDDFMRGYFLDGRNAYSTIVGELVSAAHRASIKAKDHSYYTEPIEGSEDLSMMSIVGNYEGTYADLLHFVNEIDRSKKLIIIETLSAQPQQGSAGVLNISIKFDSFVRDALPNPGAAEAKEVAVR